jgi:hypothetical protein
MLTQEELKKEFHYNPETGHFIHLESDCITGHRRGRKNYVGITIGDRAYYAHRIAWLYMTGEHPKELIHHINNRPRDNRWCNLAPISNAENMKCQKLRSNNNSGFNGVGWHKISNKWIVRICINGKLKHLGLFKELKDAIKCRQKANKKYGYDINHGKAVA